jgi:hypothetical protein
VDDRPWTVHVNVDDGHRADNVDDRPWTVHANMDDRPRVV